MSSILDTTGSPTGRRTKANRDAQYKFLNDRIVKVEKNFTTISQRFQILSTKMRRFKMRGENLAKAVNDYADDESISIKNGLRGFVDCSLALQSHLQAQADHIDDKVILPLHQYTHLCKNLKEELKAGFATRDKLLAKEKQMERVKNKDPTNKNKLVSMAVEGDVMKVRENAEKQTKSLEEEVDNFEKDKIRDVKAIFSSYIHGAMYYHAKALEVLTLADQYIANINEEEDLEEFRNALHVNRISPRLDVIKAHSAVSLDATDSQDRDIKSYDEVR